MASKIVKGINESYKRRYEKKRAKGHGVYALSLPGTPNGIHASYAKADDPCRCGRCSA
jgi:hypothetical protein